MTNHLLLIFLFTFAVTRKSGGNTINDEEAVRKVLHMNTPDQVVDRLTDKTDLGDKFEVRFELAATFGKLHFESLKMIDDNLKIMVAGAISKINNMNVRTWKGILDSLDEVPSLKMVGRRRDFTDEYMIQPQTKLIDFYSHTVDHFVAFMIEFWFDRLTENYIPLREMNINITNLAYYVAKGEQITASNALVGNDIKHKELMDLAILRFPDITNPYLTVFMINLEAYRDSLRLFVVQSIVTGVRCRFNYARYVPNEEYIKNLRKETKQALIKDIDTLFDM